MADVGGPRSIELPIVELDGRHGAARLRELLAGLPGVVGVTVNPTERLARVAFNPTETGVRSLVDCARAAGYTVGTASTQLGIQGMYCASCVTRIERALEQTPGVLAASVNPATEQARVEYLPGLVDSAGLSRAIESAGYQAREAPAPAESALGREEADQQREYRGPDAEVVVRRRRSAAPTMVLSYPWLIPGSAGPPAAGERASSAPAGG
ncbi:MAG: hypothetical protein KatS3mg060_2284 [Dehalococcoidia bacterium]|nr:MAG: hypothetical protein KatS3mg060_2284 [Dehalococcoidia bacterium]